jgi:alpha-L-fucosidase
VLSLKDCIHLLVKVVVRDGNLLLNVGPTPEGEIEPAQAGRLREIGKWLEEYGESVYGTRGGPFPPEDWGGYTHRENRLFVHVLRWPQGPITIPAPGKKIVKSRCLTGGTVTLKEAAEGLVLTVPSEQRQELDTIIEIEFSGGPMSRAPGPLGDSGGGASGNCP